MKGQHAIVLDDTPHTLRHREGCHTLVELKHWFFHYHLLFAVALLTVGLAAALSIHTQDQWTVLGGIVGGVFSLIFFTQKQKLEELHLFKSLFATFTSRYDRMNESLNSIRDGDPNR